MGGGARTQHVVTTGLTGDRIGIRVQTARAAYVPIPLECELLAERTCRTGVGLLPRARARHPYRVPVPVPRPYTPRAQGVASWQLTPLAGTYCYMPSLRRLQVARPTERGWRVPELERITSPLTPRLAAWRDGLRDHPDAEFARYITMGLQSGFRIGFDGSTALRSARRNMPSVLEHPEVVDQYVGDESVAGRILGPFPRGAIPDLHINRLGVIPKGHTPGKWRLITDLSHPDGHSVNDGIDPQLCSLRYTSVDRVARMAQSIGRGTLLAKLDIKSAYRLVPVHPGDRPLLGFEWHGECYVDGMLPFGLRSAPKIFTAVADALEWIVRRKGVQHIDHYLDDFIILGPRGALDCAQALDTVLRACTDLGVPLAMEKLEGPTECLTFLGIELDTTAGVLRLPQDKLDRTHTLLAQWARKRTCTRRELESLIGTLQHACKVVRPGRSFLRRMIDLLRVPHRPYHHVRLNQQFQADLLWWQLFATGWNGVAIMPPAAPATVDVTSDASGHWGCGAWCRHSWFQFEWPDSAQHHHIAFKELFAVLLSCATWGSQWQSARIRCWCDNLAAVHGVNSRSCRDPALMHLLRCLFFLEAHYQFEVVASHIPGRANTLADDLSRNLLPSFLAKAPLMDPLPSPIPLHIPPLLLDPSDSTAPAWMRRFATSFAEG